MAMTMTRNKRPLTFEDLKGLRAEGYIRDSTLDQKDGFGPDIQRHNEERFAQSYGLLLGSRWYTEFESGRGVDKRTEFLRFVEDARLDRFDVLLVDHTSRFGRNQADCIRCKDELQRLGKTVIFVSQGIISGSDRDFLSERINETLDEQYSRNLSRYVSAGMAEKAEHGLANGLAPFGYKSELIGNQRREHKVIDPETIPILHKLLTEYSTGDFSFVQVADRLNAAGHRRKTGTLLSGYFVRDILSNRFYDGKVVYHRRQADELVIDGVHEVPEEIRQLWRKCQQVKKERLNKESGRPRVQARSFPFARVLICHYCGQPYYGEAVDRGGWTDLRLAHERRFQGRACHVKPRSRSVISIVREFGDRVVPYLRLPQTWEAQIEEALRTETQDSPELIAQRIRTEKALENIRKQHKWGDISDEEYRQERQELENQRKSFMRTTTSHSPNLERAAQLLDDLPALWSHPGVTDQQREAMIKEIFNRVTVGGKNLVSIEPKLEYEPLFGAILAQQKVGNCTVDPPPSPPEKLKPPPDREGGFRLAQPV